jgi:hypothetical protein
MSIERIHVNGIGTYEIVVAEGGEGIGARIALRSLARSTNDRLGTEGPARASR